MKLLWVAADLPGSKIIRWGLDSDCSHFAVSFDEATESELGMKLCKGVAFHSYGKGTHLSWLKTFLRRYTVVHALELATPLTLAEEERVYQAVVNAEDDRPYDYPAFAWFSWRVLLKKLFRWQLGSTNNWQRDGSRLCTGIAPAVLKALGISYPPKLDPEMVPPHELFLLLLDSGRFRSTPGWVEASGGI